MSKSLRLIAALLALLAVPAVAQTTRPATPTAPPPAIPPTTSVPRVAPPSAAVAPPVAATPAAAGKRLDINSATAEQLDSLPGIGPVRSKAIVAGRPYADMSDLVTKKVLTQSVFDGIKDRIALANINTSTAAQMEKTLKGIGDVRAKAIVTGRPYATPQDLVTKGVLPQGTYNGMKDLITY
jgi:DNA uptake protein ComE-like DNA-binding protein